MSFSVLSNTCVQLVPAAEAVNSGSAFADRHDD